MNLKPADLPPELKDGIQLINEGFYFKAHEVLETQWLIEEGITRNLYQGLIQLSAALFHLERGNTKGAIKLLKMAEENFLLLEHSDYLIDLQQLLTDIQRLRNQISSRPVSKSTINQSGSFHITLITIK